MMLARFLTWLRWPSVVVLLVALNPLSVAAAASSFRLEETEIVIPQVDYEGAIKHKPNDPLPYLDFDEVQWDRVVEKRHRAVMLENEYLHVTILPEMGRVYSMVFKPTGSETLWQNDIVRPGRANNETGWWLWLGGIEYTLPKDEHGTTWALPWKYSILEDGPKRKALRMEVVEPGTGLVESISFSIYPGIAYLEAEILIRNPGADRVEFAHWVNPMWVPGGENELTDNTEFILPTEQILVEERWQKNLGPSPQPWPENPLRFIRNWKVGDIMADGLEAGFFGAYSHDAEEGVVRVFDPLKNPGVDIWTYGFRPNGIPMGSGRPNKGYVEIWGGTVKHFPHERTPLDAGSHIHWTEWIYPFQKTSGVTLANENASVNFLVTTDWRTARISICPTRSIDNASVEVRSLGKVLFRDLVEMSPAAPYKKELKRLRDLQGRDLTLVVSSAGAELVRCQPSSWSLVRSD
jgi:hypothetical protein